MTHHQTQQEKRRTALVLGATGGIGGEVARCLLQRGWTVRALHRRSSHPPAPGEGGSFEWIQGDAMNAADVSAAAKGADVLVHAVNPPGYRRWSELVLPMLDNSIAAARESGLLLLLPGTVYNFGLPAAGEIAGQAAAEHAGELTENAPQQPATRKGLIRVEMERRLRAAAALGVRSLVVRAGDFGARAGNNWFSQGLVKPGRPIKAIVNPGRPGVGHQWAYLPDVARTMVDLIERRDELEAFAVFHMQGHWDSDGTALIAAIKRASGDASLPVRSFPWWLVRMASPVVLAGTPAASATG
jgi:nucleoside-diphosphate-sugar epimerase